MKREYLDALIESYLVFAANFDQGDVPSEVVAEVDRLESVQRGLGIAPYRQRRRGRPV